MFADDQRPNTNNQLGSAEMKRITVACGLIAMFVGCDLVPQPAAMPAGAQNSSAGPASAGGMIGLDTGGPVAPVASNPPQTGAAPPIGTTPPTGSAPLTG